MRFLLIDDHKIIREGLKQILLLHFPGSKVEESSTPEEVVQKISKVKFDLVISDLSIPGTSGLEVVKQVKEVNDTLPVLILSMHPEQHYALRVLKAGAWGYVNKADGAEVLIPAITKILQGKKYIPAEIAEQLADNLSVKHSESELPHTILSEREFAVFK